MYQNRLSWSWIKLWRATWTPNHLKWIFYQFSCDIKDNYFNKSLRIHPSPSSSFASATHACTIDKRTNQGPPSASRTRKKADRAWPSRAIVQGVCDLFMRRLGICDSRFVWIRVQICIFLPTVGGESANLHPDSRKPIVTNTKSDRQWRKSWFYICCLIISGLDLPSLQFVVTSLSESERQRDTPKYNVSHPLCHEVLLFFMWSSCSQLGCTVAAVSGHRPAEHARNC